MFYASLTLSKLISHLLQGLSASNSGFHLHIIIQRSGLLPSDSYMRLEDPQSEPVDAKQHERCRGEGCNGQSWRRGIYSPSTFCYVELSHLARLALKGTRYRPYLPNNREVKDIRLVNRMARFPILVSSKLSLFFFFPKPQKLRSHGLARISSFLIPTSHHHLSLPNNNNINDLINSCNFYIYDLT